MQQMIPFDDCPVGMFLSAGGELCVKTEYGLDAYIVSTGEKFWGGAKTIAQLPQVMVRPVKVAPVRHEGTTTFITVDDVDECQSRIILDEGKKSKGCRVFYEDNPAWDVFDSLTSAYYGKQMYFTQSDGTIYSRLSCSYMTFEEAIAEACKEIGL